MRAEYERALTLAKTQLGAMPTSPSRIPLTVSGCGSHSNDDWKDTPAIKSRLAGGYCLRAPGLPRLVQFFARRNDNDKRETSKRKQSEEAAERPLESQLRDGHKGGVRTPGLWQEEARHPKTGTPPAVDELHSAESDT